MKERIKTLRKELGLTQQEFADRLGISRGNVATYETRDGNPGGSVIQLICREFHVRESWLRTGEGDMFIQKEPHPLDERLSNLLGGEAVTDEDKILVKSFLELPEGSRGAVIDFVKKCAAELSTKAQPDAAEQKTPTPVSEDGQDGLLEIALTDFHALNHGQKQQFLDLMRDGTDEEQQ